VFSSFSSDPGDAPTPSTSRNNSLDNVESSVAPAEQPAALKYEVWGTYERENVIPDFKSGSDKKWTWKVVVVEKGISEGELIRIARHLVSKYPGQRIRIFDDKKKLQQFVDRDIYFNDSTGTAKKVEFPTEWVVAHHLANINDRSDKYEGRWQLVNRYGAYISLL